jgi:dTDP-glucose 4,6-dehydratase
MGASSFAGSSFANFLINKKKFDILGTYRYKKNLKNLIFFNKIRKIKLVKVDLSKKKNPLLKIVKIFKPHYILDFASVCMVNESWLDPQYYLDVNVNSKIELVKELHKLKFLKKFIYISTPEVFGSTKNLVNESCKVFRPTTPYAISKLSFEQILMSYSYNLGAKALITRFSNFYGRGQFEHRLVPKLINCINKNTKFPMHGDGLTKRDFIFDEDFNTALVKVIKKGLTGNTYHFSTGSYNSIKKIIQVICKIKNVKFDIIVEKVMDRTGKDKYYFLDCKKTSKELNWKPKYNLFSGLKKTINFYDKNI